MVDPNWGLMQGNNALNYMQYGMQIGRDARERQNAQELTAAESELFAKPNDPNALASYAKLNPKGAFAYRQGQQEQEAAQRKEAQGQAMTVAKLFDGVTPENYQQRLSVAQRMGIDTSSAPQQFDPNWVTENRIIMQTVAERPEALSTAGKIAVDEGYQPGSPEFNARVKQIVVSEATQTIPYQPGGGVATYNAQTGQTQVIVQPNYGDQPAPAAQTGGPKPGTVIDGYQFKGGNPNDKANWVKAGGASSNTGGGFRPVSNGAGVIQSVLPNATITSGYRGPNHPLSKKNPESFHTKTRAAADIAPIPGMTFQQVKAKLEAAGYYVHPDSRDEVKNPSSHATGPHWHFVIGER